MLRQQLTDVFLFLPSIEPPPIMLHFETGSIVLVHTWYTPMSHIAAISDNRSKHSKQPQNSLQKYQQYPLGYPVSTCVRAQGEQVRILQRISLPFLPVRYPRCDLKRYDLFNA